MRKDGKGGKERWSRRRKGETEEGEGGERENEGKRDGEGRREEGYIYERRLTEGWSVTQTGGQVEYRQRPVPKPFSNSMNREHRSLSNSVAEHSQSLQDTVLGD